MSQPWEHVPAWAAEFPSDNPALHEGVSWVCLSVCGPARPIARPRASSRIPLPNVGSPRVAVHPTSAMVVGAGAPITAAVPLDAVADVASVSPSFADTAADVSDVSPSLHFDEDVAAALELALLPGEPTEPPSEPVAASGAVACEPRDPVAGSPRSKLPASVLRVLLERLDFELTPAAGAASTEAAATSEPLDLDTDDLDSGSVPDVAAALAANDDGSRLLTVDQRAVAAPSEPVQPALVAAPVTQLDERVFDGTLATRESERPGEPSAAEVVGASPERRDELVFDGGFDSGESETTGEQAAEDVLAAAPERHDEAMPAGAHEPPSSAVAAPESEKRTAFDAFVGALVEVLLASGATRAAAVLPTLLDSSDSDAGALDAEARALLITAGIAEDTGGRVRLRDGFVATARAWRDVLSGDTHDLSACGTSTLDGWAADLLKGFGIGRDGRDVRRELRRRGVAAFGMLLAA